MAFIEFFLALTTLSALGGIGYLIFDKMLGRQKAKMTEDYNNQLDLQAGEYDSQIAEVQKEAKIKNKKSLLRSKQIMTGKAAEQIAPHLKEFPYVPNDIQFLGAPIDYIVFQGSVVDEVDKIVLMEMKSGKSVLTKKQKSIKQCVQDGEVYFEEYRIKTEKIENEHIEEMAETGDCMCDTCYPIED